MSNLIIEGTANKGEIANFRVTLKEGEEIIVRDMTVGDLCHLLDGNSHEKKVGFTHELPPEILADGILRYRIRYNSEGKEEYFTFAKVLPPEKTGFLLFSKVPVVVPQPRRLVIYSSNGEIEIFALKGKGKIKANTRLYWYPLGHVEENGHVCKGNVPMRSKNIDEANRRINDFFIAGTEGHYFHTGRTIKENYSFGEMMNKLQEMDTFPEKWLQPATEGYRSAEQLTFEDVW